MLLHFQGIAIESSWSEGVYFQNYMRNKCEGNENKIILSDFHITMWTRMVEIKHKDFIDVVPKVQDIQGLHWYKNC